MLDRGRRRIWKSLYAMPLDVSSKGTEEMVGRCGHLPLGVKGSHRGQWVAGMVGWCGHLPSGAKGSLRGQRVTRTEDEYRTEEGGGLGNPYTLCLWMYYPKGRREWRGGAGICRQAQKEAIRDNRWREWRMNAGRRKGTDGESLICRPFGCLIQRNGV